MPFIMKNILFLLSKFIWKDPFYPLKRNAEGEDDDFRKVPHTLQKTNKWIFSIHFAKKKGNK